MIQNIRALWLLLPALYIAFYHTEVMSNLTTHLLSKPFSSGSEDTEPLLSESDEIDGGQDTDLTISIVPSSSTTSDSKAPYIEEAPDLSVIQNLLIHKKIPSKDYVSHHQQQIEWLIDDLKKSLALHTIDALPNTLAERVMIFSKDSVIKFDTESNAASIKLYESIITLLSDMLDRSKNTQKFQQTALLLNYQHLPMLAHTLPLQMAIEEYHHHISLLRQAVQLTLTPTLTPELLENFMRSKEGRLMLFILQQASAPATTSNVFFVGTEGEKKQFIHLSGNNNERQKLHDNTTLCFEVHHQPSL